MRYEIISDSVTACFDTDHLAIDADVDGDTILLWNDGPDGVKVPIARIKVTHAIININTGQGLCFNAS